MNRNEIESTSELVSLEKLRIDSFNQEFKNLSSFSLKQTFINSRECPHCGSHQVLCNGNYKGRKRYLCKDCGISYNDLTNTPFSGIHNQEKIISYLSCMINGDSIRKAARIINVSISTSFIWRHKLLNGLKQLPSPKMKNVREVKQISIPYSHKGQQTGLTESLRKSKISVLFMCDRTGKLDSDSIVSNHKKSNPLLARIKANTNEHTELISSTNLKNIINFPYYNIKPNNSPYSQPSTINQIVELWEEWMKRFHGVASKYLTNYLHWFDFLDNSLYKLNRENDFLQLILRH